MDQEENLNSNVYEKWYKETDYKEYPEACKDKDIAIVTLLAHAENDGRDDVDIMVRKLTYIKVKDGKVQESKYKFTVSRHPAGSIDNIKVFDSSLTTYYLNALSGREPVLRHIAGSSQLGRSLQCYSEEMIDRIYDECKKRGDHLVAKLYRTTWEIAQTVDRFENIHN